MFINYAILDNLNGQVVRNIIIPFVFVMMDQFRGPSFSVALPPGADLPSLDFWDFEACDRILNNLSFK